MLVGQMDRAVTTQLLQVGPVAVYEMQHQEPTEYEVVPVAKARPQHAQALGHAARQTGQGHGLGLLGETRSDGQSRSSISGSAWTGKDFHV